MKINSIETNERYDFFLITEKMLLNIFCAIDFLTNNNIKPKIEMNGECCERNAFYDENSRFLA